MTTIPTPAQLTREDLAAMLAMREPAEREALRCRAEAILMEECGKRVSFRGLVEFSNICRRNCRYCGIRKGNRNVKRYMLSLDEILECARFSAEAGYGSIVLQSGERDDAVFIDFVEKAVLAIKRETVSRTLPTGLGITLCVGEQEPDAYRRFFDAGAHRYLLRIETTAPALFGQLHPKAQTLAHRIACLESLKTIGFQVGTGVMIGLPGQTHEQLADDLLFFRDLDIDMIGMGPYIAHDQTPMRRHAAATRARHAEILELSLNMIAATRILLRDVNIAATTALQAMDPIGRELGLQFGANVIMPQVTPMRVRREYQLYEGKPCMDENPRHCMDCLRRRIQGIGREVLANAWGDSPHVARRRTADTLSQRNRDKNKD